MKEKLLSEVQNQHYFRSL